MDLRKARNGPTARDTSTEADPVTVTVEETKGEILGIRVSMGIPSGIRILRLATDKPTTRPVLGKSRAGISFGLWFDPIGVDLQKQPGRSCAWHFER